MLATNKDEPLCKEREMFLKVMHAYFPNSYDVQCMIGDEERNFGATSLTKLAAFHKVIIFATLYRKNNAPTLYFNRLILYWSIFYSITF